MQSHQNQLPAFRRLAAAVAVCCGFCCGRAVGDEIADASGELAAGYARQLEALAKWCQDNGLRDAAGEVQAWTPCERRRLLRFPRLPPQAGVLEPPADGQGARAEFRRRFARLRAAQADALFELAEQALRAGQVMRAYVLLSEAGRENPDHPDVRRILGYRREGDLWLTPYAAQQAQRGLVWHDRFGWLPEEHLERYAAGQRYYRRNWISAERDAQLHREIDAGWRIETEHYAITTNHSLEGGARLAARLERLHGVWSQLFAGFHSTPSQLKRLFASGRPPKPRRKHSVMYLRDRDEYLRLLRGEIPENVKTTGVYIADRRTAYFYHAEDDDPSTLYHEATHQLFSEHSAMPAGVGARANFWVIEGVACYMESLAVARDELTLGGIDAYRLQDARYYCLVHDFYLPLAELSQLGMLELQRHGEIGKLYAQGAALVDFLMHAQGGQHADDLVRFLRTVYAGRDRSGTLASLTGISYPRLDAAFREFLEVKNGELAHLPRAAELTYLTLGASEVDDAGLAALPELPRIQWIDLSKTAVTDAGLAELKRFAGLRHLNLGATGVTDAGLSELAALGQLEKLELWNTAVGDAGIAQLKGLRRLKELDVRGIKVSDATLGQLRGALPGLKITR